MTAFKYYAEFLIYQGIKLFFLMLPRKFSLGVGRFLGIAVYFLDKKHRQIALSNLKIAFGSELSLSALKDIARKSFIHLENSSLITSNSITSMRKRETDSSKLKERRI